MTLRGGVADEGLYKILRENEAVAYHHILRALVMRNGPDLAGVSAEMLRDVRELLKIPDDRHDIELKAALHAPDVLAAYSLPTLRKRPSSAVDIDLTPSHDSDSTEDDTAPPLKRPRL